MSVQLEESLLDFNLDFLHQTSNKILIAPEKYNDKNEKCRIAINVAKKKIVATDSLIRKYYEKKEELEQLEKALYASKEECKQVCIDFRNVTDRCNQLDNEVQVLCNCNQQLQAKCSEQENLVGAMQSHVHQLQTLVKENDTVIEGLKIENQLRKANVDDCEKRISLFQKENDALLKHMSLMKDIIFGKRKLNKRYKRILNKYNKNYESDGNDSVLEGTESDDDTNSHCIYDDIYEEKIPVKDYAPELEPVMAKNDNDLESDFSNEQASADTGRGSSLAFSDTDKCFHSPDYFMDHSPTDTEDITEKIQINHIVTSPNLSDQKIDMATNPTPAKQSIFSPTKTKVPFEVNEVNACTELGYDSQTKIILPIEQQQNYKEKQFDVNKIVHKDAITKVSDETLACHNESSEKECLEMNNSNKFNENNRRDGEIEMILSKMRLSHSLITPIPTTPLKSGYSLSDPVNKESNLCMPDHNFVCKDALKVKEENLSLRANLVKLANEIESIKDILKNKNLLTQQHLMTYNTEIEFDVNDDNIRKLPAEVNQNNSESLHLEMMNNSISGDDSPVFDECDIVKSTRKSLKRLKFEEPLLSLQNGSPRLLPESIQEKDDQKEVISDVRNIDDNANNSIRKAYKQRKLTKLERLRQKLVPKNKIKANIAPIGKLRKKHKHRIINGVTDKVAISLKNKKAYEKAVKIMVELKSQQKTGIAQKTNSFENKGKQTFKKKNSIPINKSQFKMSSISEISTSNKNLTNQIDQNTKDQQNSKKIIILENILLTNSQNCNEKKISSQDSLHTCLTDVSAAKNTNKVTFNEKEDCLVTTPKLKVLQEENINVSNISADRNDFINDKEKEKKNNVIEDKQQMQTQYLPIDSNTKISVSPCAEKIQNTEDENKVTNDLSEASNVHTKNMTSETEKNDITTPLVKQHELPKNLITTRSRTKIADSSSSCQIKHYNIVDDQLKLADEIIQALNNNVDIKNDIQQRARKRQNRMSDDRSDIECKRRLRSSTVRAPSTEENIKIPENIKNVAVSAVADSNVKLDTACVNLSQEEPKTKEAHRQIRDNIVSYDDLDLFSPNIKQIHSSQNSATEKEVMHPKNSILCMMLDKYGKRSAKNFSKKISDTVINTISQTIENEISTIIDAPSKDSKELMNGFVDKIKKWNNKQFMAGLMQYLKDPQRKIELYGKTCTPPAPPMTKSEQILLYVVAQLKNIWTTINVVDCLLHNMEYVLFKLNRTPGFDTIESMSHFYAITCRYFKMKSRLRLFMLDAMYCIQFKSVPLIKQCMEVWMHVLPLAHMGIAKSTLVTCMVYLLHFYKCDDKYNRVQDIRYLLNRKYFYEITEWNEPKIIEMFRNAIRDVKVIPMEIKLLRIALIIIAKRHGPKWCQKNIIRNLLIPMIESDDYPERVKIFCVSMLGPLLKTYPIDMRVHFEIVMNMLLDMLKRNPSPEMHEAIFTSLIYMSRHNYNRVVHTLLTWKPQRISPEFEKLISDFVCQKPLKMWKTTLSKMNVMQ